MRTLPGRAAWILIAFLSTVFFLNAQEDIGTQEGPKALDFAGTWVPADWDGKKSIIAGITRIEITPREENYLVVVHWISQGWPTRFRGTGVVEKDKLKVIIETTNHGVGREDLWLLDDKGNLVTWGKAFKRPG